MAALLLAFGAVTASAATLQVAPPAEGGSDAGNCAVGTPCATIQKAVNVATAGDVIEVAAGEYAENVTVSKELTLRGAQAGTPRPNVPASQRSTISASGQVITVTGNGAKIEGFAFVNPGSGGSAIYARQGTKIFNLGVADNLRESGDGSLLNVGNAESLVIEGNRVAHTTAPALLFGGETKASIVRGNEFVEGSSTAIQLAPTLGANREMTIAGNNLSHVARGIKVEALAAGTAVTIRENDLSEESIAGILNEGTQTFDARRNWWGCNAGPSESGCSKLENSAGGTPVETSDFLALRLSAEPTIVLTGEAAQLHADVVGSETHTLATAFVTNAPIAFSSSLGEVEEGTPLTAGRATGTFRSNVTGTATVRATLDAQTAINHVQIEPQPTPPPPETIVEKVIETVVQTQYVDVPGPATPAPTPARPHLGIVRATAPIAHGAAKVLVECVGEAGQNCGGVLTIRFRGTEAKETFEVAAGKRGTIAVPLSEGALARVKRAGKNAKATATARTVQVYGSAETRHASVRLG